MRGARIALGIFVLAVLGGCASAPTLPTLIEQRQVFEQRAMARYESGDPAAAAHNFRQALQTAELADDRTALIINLINLGAVESDLAHHAAAAAAYDRALRLAALEGRADLELRALAGLAELRYRQGEREAAEGLYRRLLDHPAAQSDRGLRLMAWNGLALCAMERGDPDAAARHLAQAEALGESAATLLNRATLELRRGQLSAAEAAARRALAIDRTRRHVPGIANDLELLGEVVRRRGREQEAQLYFNQALALYEQLQSPQAVARLRRRLAP